MAEVKRARVVVSGQVQGVAFRYYTQRWASDLGLTGWVRNLPDGAVEVLAEGESSAVGELIRRLRHGPPLAQVDGVDIDWQEPVGEFPDFRIIRYR